MNEELFLFPHSPRMMCGSLGEGKDESSHSGTKEGLSVGADIGITYSIQPDKVPWYSRSTAKE